ncbi:MAG: RNA 2',3'-cyclic phosphodiesterase [Clostridiales bacterium]|jgi:2'-5' RNA ligase|nr:RNA 2',3'-cyclic phosphodiesterase [Clostridiales bacterium]
MRLFVAINFKGGTPERLTALGNELSARSAHGNFTPTENMHLTVVFLGECDESRTAAAKAALAETEFKPFDIEIDYVGRVKRAGSGDIWWAGVKTGKPLLDLRRAVCEKLTAAGFPLENPTYRHGKTPARRHTGRTDDPAAERASFEARVYAPHITLGRGVTTDFEPKRINPFGETVTEIDLMRSDMLNGGLVYTSIYRRGTRRVIPDNPFAA